MNPTSRTAPSWRDRWSARMALSAWLRPGLAALVLLALTVVPALGATVTEVNSPTPDGFYGQGQVISITVQFDAAVTVDTTGGIPQLSLISGGSAAYSGGTGTTVLTFAYTVAANETTMLPILQPLDYSNTAALTLNGGTIQDAGLVDADLTLPVPGTPNSLGANKSLFIDGIAPVALLIPSTPGPTNLGTLTYAIMFDKPVSGGAVGDFTLTVVSGSIAGASILGFSGGPVPTVTIATGTGSGVLRLDLDPGSTFVDGAGNIPAATPGSPVAFVPLTIGSLGTTSGPAAGGTAGVVINGTSFDGGTTVTFGGAPATITAVTSTAITCTTPAHVAGAVDVVVSGNGQSATLAAGFAYLPGLTSLDVAAGTASGGTVVTITGSGFASGGTLVAFGGALAALTSVNATTIVCTTPAHAAGAVDVLIVVNGQQVAGAGAFTYQPLAISALGTVSGPAGGGTSVVITGTGFIAGNLAGTTVAFGGAAATVTAVTATSITCTAPAQVVGPVDVMAVSNGQQVISYRAFTYLPGIASLDVTTGSAAGGTTVTMTGAGFVNGATTVAFGGTPAAITAVSATTIVCTTPAHAAGSVAVTVAVNGQTATSSGAFAYLPVIGALDIAAGPAAGGTTVVITGAGFTPGTTVAFGGTAATVAAVAATSLTCVTPARAAGTVAVAVTSSGQTATSAGAFTFQAVTLAGLDRSSGPTGGGTSVVITGTGFTAGDLAGTTVTFAGASAAVTAVTATTITCTTPAHAVALVDVVVGSNGSTLTLVGAYTFLPVVTSLDVVTGTAAGGSTVRISGSGFQSPVAVTFGGTSATVTATSATTIDCTVPAHAVGLVNVAVTVNGVTVTSANAFTYYSLAVAVAPFAIEAGSLGNPITGLVTTSTDPSLVPAANALAYQVEIAPGQGALTRHRAGDPPAGLTLTAGSTFTQDDLNLGLVRYSHTGAANAVRDDFAFSVSYRGPASDPNEPRSATRFVPIDIQRTLPVVAIAGSTAPLYRVQTGIPVGIADLATVTIPAASNGGILVRSDQDGLLTCTVTTGGESQDVLAIAPLGAVTLAGSSLAYNGNVIGTIAGGTGGQALTVNLLHPSIPVTPTVATAILRSLVFSSTSKRPGLTQRRVAIRATNGLGDASPAVEQLLDLAPYNVAPSVADLALVALPGIPVPGQVQVVDGDDAVHAFVVATPPGKGRVTLDGATGSFTYTADLGSQGQDTFTITASDLGTPGAPVTADTLPKSGTGTVTVSISGSEQVGAGLAPVITSNPPMEVAAGATLRYAPVLAAADPNFRYRVIWVTHPADEAAVAARFASDHVINWPDVPGDLPYQVFWIVITDPVSGTATSQRVLIRVNPPALVPASPSASALPKGNG